MGKKRDEKGKHFFLYGAYFLGILLLCFGCASFGVQRNRQGNKALALADTFVREGNYEGALEINERVLKRFPGGSPGDKALYRLGFILMHPDNPKRDHKQALEYFQQLVHDFPRSPLREEVRVWMAVLEDLDGCRHEAKDLQEKVRTLKKQLNALKEIDIGIEEKKREDLPTE